MHRTATTTNNILIVPRLRDSGECVCVCDFYNRGKKEFLDDTLFPNTNADYLSFTYN
jgi:hypothetical protein